MNLHLAEIATQVKPGAHAVLLLDQAGWHLSGHLVVPPNISLVSLPPKCPELNPVENVWQFLRDNWLSNRIFKSYERYPRSLLLCLEPIPRSALENYVHRHPRLGSAVLTNENWPKSFFSLSHDILNLLFSYPFNRETSSI
jgi:transposase